MTRLLFFILIFISFSEKSQATVNWSCVSGFCGSNIVTSGTTTSIFYSNIDADFLNTDTTNCSTVVNPNCKKPSDTLQIQVVPTSSSTVTVTSASKLYLYVVPTSGQSGYAPTIGASWSAGSVASVLTGIVSGGTYTLSTTFANLCSKGDASLGTSCENDSLTSNTYRVSVVIDADGDTTYNTGDEIAFFNFYPKSTTSSTTSGQQGFHTYTAFPGDEKIHIKNSIASDNVATLNNIGAKSVRFYYQLTNTPAATLSTMTATGTYQEVSIASDRTLSSYYIQPLDNVTGSYQYCTIAATVDNAGNIGFLTDTSTRTVTSQCAAPSQVAGLLSQNGNCFIATAAFGSPMAGEVLTLRKFRDDILLKSLAGKKFVRWYYANSPPWADRIRENETAKKIVRGALWPAIGFSILALKFGATNAAMLFITLLLMPLLFAQYFILKKRLP